MPPPRLPGIILVKSSWNANLVRRALTHLMIALACGLAAAGAASRLPVAQQPAYDLAAIPTAGALRWTSAGHPTLVANLWWLRTVQYIGDPLADRRGWDKLYPALLLVTELDPLHGYAYQVGANVLSSTDRVEESNALLERGIARVPDRYILPFQRAVNAFLYAGDYAEAARWFERAAQVPGAPSERMHAYAAAMLTKANAHDAALALLRQLLETAHDEPSRKAIQRQLAQVELERDAAMLEAASREYRRRYKAAPPSLEALITGGVIARIPPDPFGGTYYLDPEGTVRSTANGHRYERSMSEAERKAKKEVARERVRQMEESIR